MKLDNNWCCEMMKNAIEDRESALQYYAPLRMYSIRELNQPAARIIKYCPWCATKLPESLYDKQEEILEKEYGLTETWEGGKDYDRIPKEFNTEEWWKKRGL